MRIQLWSYNYDPEPTGIGPVSRVWAQAMRDRGHEIQVVAAHTHYPEPRWGTKLLPYREERDGIPVVRLPLWIGRASRRDRYRQELSFMLAQSAAAPFLGRADALVSVSPSFPALLPALTNARVRCIPWLLWLQDILPDGAAATGLLDDGPAMRAARRLELASYRAARRIVVPSRAFIRNLVAKGVPEAKIELIYNPATRSPRRDPARRRAGRPMRILCMGNIGHSQGLAAVVRAFEEAGPIGNPPAKLVITGTGVAADEVRREIRSDRVEMLGLVDDERLEDELAKATMGLVAQRPGVIEFNVPSKLMNFMAYGLPAIAMADPSSEVARIVEESGGGWVVDSGATPDLLPKAVVRLDARVDEIAGRGRAALGYARHHFTPAAIAERSEQALGASITEFDRRSQPLPTQSTTMQRSRG